MEVSPVPTIPYVKDFKLAPYWNNHLFLVGTGVPGLGVPNPNTARSRSATHRSKGLPVPPAPRSSSVPDFGFHFARFASRSETRRERVETPPRPTDERLDIRSEAPRGTSGFGRVSLRSELRSELGSAAL